MTMRIRTITFDCADWRPLVAFWSRATDYQEDPDNPNRPDDPEGLLVDPVGGLSLLFQVVPEGKVVKNRIHLDLQPDTTRDAEVARLLDLGATLVGDHRRPDGTGWVTLADPAGNEFCVERSTAERAAATTT
jgi:Glyoxalase-like domain